MDREDFGRRLYNGQKESGPHGLPDRGIAGGFSVFHFVAEPLEKLRGSIPVAEDDLAHLFQLQLHMLRVVVIDSLAEPYWRRNRRPQALRFVQLGYELVRALRTERIAAKLNERRLR